VPQGRDGSVQKGEAMNPYSRLGLRLLRVSAALAVLVLLGAWLAVQGSARMSPVTREALRATFETDIARLVYRWDPNDARPEQARTDALFDFVYETFDSSAWIPQSLFDSNLLSQVVAGSVDTIVADHVGLVPWRENEAVVAYGMAPRASAAAPVSWTVNCLVCHMAEIDGVAYFGAGTKTFDDKWLGEALKMLTSRRGRLLLPPGSADNAEAADAYRILTSHHHEKIDSLTRGRSTAFAASYVELYMRPHNGAMPAPSLVGRGDVKTPPLWHTAAKLPVGRWYSDGSYHGDVPLMASSMELEKDRSFDALMTTVIPKIREQFASVIGHLRPPPYPYPIDRDLAERGKALFYSAEIGCSRCHGRYDGNGGVEWPGVHVDVGTDRARRAIVTRGFVAAFNNSPLAAHGALAPAEGYAATPLTGVWANYPYLHNGSVPTLHHLLGPVTERPSAFEVMAARSFDRERVGQRLFIDPTHGRAADATLGQRFGHDRNWFVIDRPGSSNAGHDMWPRIRTDENRRALIEYLKTL
jgi:hypothetical protein